MVCLQTFYVNWDTESEREFVDDSKTNLPSFGIVFRLDVPFQVHYVC